MVKKAGCEGGFDGLCCRMVIETKRVFDGCRMIDDNITLTLTTDEALPQDARFVSARVVSSELVNYSVTDNGDTSRVSGELVTRYAVTYEYGGGVFTVAARTLENIDVNLRLPSRALVPYSIESSTSLNILGGAIIGQSAVSITGCILRIIKVTAPVDILIPTYGYCKYPPCTGCVCPGFEDARVFPGFDGE